MKLLKFCIVTFVNAQSCVWIDSNEEQYKTDTKSDTDSKLENIE